VEADSGLLKRSLGEWLEDLAAPSPVPGGGSALALALAAAAAVLAMAARVSTGSWEDALGAVSQAEALRARCSQLAERNASAYRAALASPAGTEPPGSRRDWAIGQAFAAAAEPPLGLARTAADTAELAALVAARGEERVRVDALTAALLAAAVARGAAALVAVNLTATTDDPRVAEAEQLASHAEAAAARIRQG
jgi:methenyltetrahydrofolate cyclohydrolase